MSKISPCTQVSSPWPWCIVCLVAAASWQFVTSKDEIWSLMWLQKSSTMLSTLQVFYYHYYMLYTLNFKNVLSRAVHCNTLSLNNLFILTSLCSSFVVFLIQVLKFLPSSILQLLSLHMLLIDVQLLFLCLDIIKLCLSNLLNYKSVLALHRCFCCQGFLKVCPRRIHIQPATYMTLCI